MSFKSNKSIQVEKVKGKGSFIGPSKEMVDKYVNNTSREKKSIFIKKKR